MKFLRDETDEPPSSASHAIVGLPLGLIILWYYVGAIALIRAPYWVIAASYILFSALLVGGVAGKKQAYETVKGIAENSLDAYWRRQFVEIPLARITWPLGCIVGLFVVQGWTFAHFCRCVCKGSPQAFLGAGGQTLPTHQGSIFRWMNYSIDRFLDVASLSATEIYGFSFSGIRHNPESFPACNLVFAQTAVLSLTLVTLLVNAIFFGLRWYRGQSPDASST